MWEPASAVERWGNAYFAWMGGVEYAIAGILSFIVAYCFLRDYSDGSPVTRGYFLVLMWKRLGMGVICFSQVLMFLSPKAGVLLTAASLAAYIIISVVFIVVWANKGKRINRDEYIGHALRQEGLDIDTMSQPDAVCFAQRAVSLAAQKTGADLSNIHHA